jgi:uncharacterized protein involved in outer membrane biogenesis
VQTTLLGFAIAIILALVTALVGPLFVDWTRYRAEFEARATRLTGLDFRITGSIDARVLPTPTIVMHGIEFGRPDDSGKVRARSLRLEFALGALARGEWRIANARLDGPELAAGLDSTGRLDWPAPKIGFDPEGVSIERLTIRDGRALLADGASGARLLFEKVEFKGEIRSLTGPARGEGSFVIAGQHYPYRLATSRLGEDSTVKVRLSIDPIHRPVTAEADLSIGFERGAPRFEGTIHLARAVGRAPAGTQALIIEPWRTTSRIKGDSAGAVLEQIEFQYGPDERAIKLHGNAQVKFGQQPHANVVLTSSQIDLERALAVPDAPRRRPLAALKTFLNIFNAAPQLPLPTTLSIGVESLAFGGAMVQRLGADIEIDSQELRIRLLEFRAPGLTQVRLSGRVLNAARFEGSTQIESNDPRVLLGWLTERNDIQAVAAGPLRLSGDVRLSDDTISTDRLSFDFDRMTVAGRMAYFWPNQDRPARLDAELTSPEIDLDRIHGLGAAMLGGIGFEWPREGALSLKIGRASIFGVQAKQVDVNTRLDNNGLEIDRLVIADFGGTAAAIKGRIDTTSQSPHGTLTLNLDARTLDGLLAVIEKLAPQSAEPLRRSAERLSPLALRASLTMDPASGGALASTKFNVEGRAGKLSRISVFGDANTSSAAFKADKIAALGAAKVNITARVEADEGEPLIEFLRLDKFFLVDKRSARLNLSAKGNLDGALDIDGRLAAGALDISANGKLRVAKEPTAEFDLTINNASLRSPRPVVAGLPAEALPGSATARLAWAQNTLQIAQIRGTLAGSSVAGSLTLKIGEPISLNGSMEMSAVDLPGAIAAVIGVPARPAPTSPGRVLAWASEPFEHFLGPLNGQIALKSARTALTPQLAVRDFQGTISFAESRVTLQMAEGVLAGGRASGELSLLRQPDGVLARSRLKVEGASAAELLPGDGVVSGRLSFVLSAEGAGMSSVALVGSLSGSGSFTLENGRVAWLDPRAFQAVMRAVDQGLPIDANRVKDKMELALAAGPFAAQRADGSVAIDAGQARTTISITEVKGAELVLSGNVNLTDGALDGQLVLFGLAAAGAPASTRPEITMLLRGPFDAPVRTMDVAALANWLALRSIEQQSKKLDLLEGREPPTTFFAPPEQPPEESSVIQSTHGPAASTPPTNPQAIQQPSAARNRPVAQKPKPRKQVQTAPPPVDLRPAPISPFQWLFGVH